MTFHDRDLAEARRKVANHLCEERISRSFTFSIPGKGSFYRYSLTWTPGSVTLAGDCGEMALTHYQALWDFQKGMSWLASSSTDYLLSKSDKKRSFDREATLRDIVGMADERASYTLKGFEADLAAWELDRPDIGVPAAIYQGCPVDEDAAERWEWLPQWLEDKPKLEFETGMDRRFGRPPRMVDMPPDGLELWHRLRETLCPWEPNELTFTREGRADIAESLRAYLDDGGHEHAADLCSQAGLDDYYGSDSWTFHDKLQIEALRTGARKIIAKVWPYEWLSQ